MAITPQQINAAFYSAFGRNATKAELSYWANKTQTTLAQKLRATPGAGGAYGPGTGATAQKDPYAALPESLRAIYDQAKGLLDELIKRGQIINPNIEITPEKTAEFMHQAEQELNPYYQTQIKLAREGFLTSLGYDKETIQRQEEDLSRKYTQAFRGIGEQAADTGFALSGRRQEAERNLDTDVQRQIEEGRRQLGNRASELARAFAQAYGGQPLKDIGGISIGAAPQAAGGQYVRPGGQTGLYSLSPDIYDQLVGSEEFNRRAAVQSRASELESAFRVGEAAKQYRSLTI